MMAKHPNADVYHEHWPKIGVQLDYRGGVRYWAVVMLGGVVIPHEMDAFNEVLKDAAAACEQLNDAMLNRAREAERSKRDPIDRTHPQVSQ